MAINITRVESPILIIVRTFKFDRVDNIGACIQESRENIIRNGAVNNIQPLQKLALP